MYISRHKSINNESNSCAFRQITGIIHKISLFDDNFSKKNNRHQKLLVYITLMSIYHIVDRWQWASYKVNEFNTELHKNNSTVSFPRNWLTRDDAISISRVQHYTALMGVYHFLWRRCDEVMDSLFTQEALTSHNDRFVLPYAHKIQKKHSFQQLEE